MIASSEFPRILLIGASPVRGQATGTDVTISNLLGIWPADCLAQVFVGSPGEAQEALGLGLPISPQNALLDYSLRRLVDQSNALRGSSVPVTAGIPMRSHKDLKARAHLAMRFAADASSISIPREIRLRAKEFAPDVIYSLLGNLRIIELTQRLVDDLDKPLLPHFMDDWMHTLYTSGELWGFPRKLFDRRIRHLMTSAPAGMSISRIMAEEYSREFGIPFSTVANPAAEAYFDLPSRDESECPVIMYVGGLHVGRAKVLGDVADALDRYVPPTGKRLKAQLVVHCPSEHLRLYGSGLRDRSTVVLAGSISPGEVASALARADVLLHVESADPEAVSFTRLSISTKIPQYLAAGRPVLCYAPSSLASSLLIAESGGGLVVSRQQELAAAVESLMNDAGRLRELGTRGRSYARSHLSHGAVSARFLHTIRLTANAGRPQVASRGPLDSVG